jgi:hypothetical protein
VANGFEERKQVFQTNSDVDFYYILIMKPDLEKRRLTTKTAGILLETFKVVLVLFNLIMIFLKKFVNVVMKLVLIMIWTVTWFWSLQEGIIWISKL